LLFRSISMTAAVAAMSKIISRVSFQNTEIDCKLSATCCNALFSEDSSTIGVLCRNLHIAHLLLNLPVPS
jgi:hypothetical protein